MCKNWELKGACPFQHKVIDKINSVPLLMAQWILRLKRIFIKISKLLLVNRTFKKDTVLMVKDVSIYTENYFLYKNSKTISLRYIKKKNFLLIFLNRSQKKIIKTKIDLDNKISTFKMTLIYFFIIIT